MRVALPISALLLTGCLASQDLPAYQPLPNQGQYVRPEWLAPLPPQRVPATDLCQSYNYQTLVGRHEGAIFIAGIPGSKRVVKPALTEEFEADFPQLPEDANPYIEVRDYLPGQSLYAPSITVVDDPTRLGTFQGDRLTLTLDADGYVQDVACG